MILFVCFLVCFFGLFFLVCVLVCAYLNMDVVHLAAVCIDIAFFCWMIYKFPSVRFTFKEFCSLICFISFFVYACGG